MLLDSQLHSLLNHRNVVWPHLEGRVLSSVQGCLVDIDYEALWACARLQTMTWNTYRTLHISTSVLAYLGMIWISPSPTINPLTILHVVSLCSVGAPHKWLHAVVYSKVVDASDLLLMHESKVQMSSHAFVSGCWMSKLSWSRFCKEGFNKRLKVVMVSCRLYAGRGNCTVLLCRSCLAECDDPPPVVPRYRLQHSKPGEFTPCKANCFDLTIMHANIAAMCTTNPTASLKPR